MYDIKYKIFDVELHKNLLQFDTLPLKDKYSHRIYYLQKYFKPFKNLTDLSLQ